jgi:prepilin-type N-terminal cleavage/methylation domain-containing protein
VSTTQRHPDGFTIVEVLVTLALFAIAIAGLTMLMTSVQQSQRNSSYLEAATNAARQKLEHIRNSEFTTITDGADFTSELPDSLPSGKGTVAVSIPPNAPLSKKFDVTVSYKVNAVPKSVTISAYADSPAGS